MTEPAPVATVDPRFKYQDIRPPAVPVEILDSIATSIFDPAATKLGWLGAIWSGLKLVLALIYLVARDKLMKAQMEFKKQVYEREQAASNQADLNRDDLGGEPRQ